MILNYFPTIAKQRYFMPNDVNQLFDSIIVARSNTTIKSGAIKNIFGERRDKRVI